MNETIKENNQIIMQSTITTYGSSNDVLNYTGNDSVVESDGSNTGTTDATTGSINNSISNDRTANSFDVVNSVSDSDITHYSQDTAQEFIQIQKDINTNLEQANTTLVAINSLLVLIFALLLFEWTEKKIKIVVDKFTDKRRR